MDSNQKVYQMIGLATKAGKTKCGEFSTEESVRKGRARLVIVSEDASENTKESFTNMCAHYQVELVIFGNKDQLGRSMGKGMRASLSVEDQGLADAIGKRMTMNGGSEV